MAFYAEMLRRGSWLVNNANMIYMYKRVLQREWEVKREEQHRKYQEWYNSLTDEERKEVDQRRREKERREHEKSMLALYQLMRLPMMIAGLYDHSYNRFSEMYNYDGTINEDFFRNMRDEEKDAEIVNTEAVNV